MDSGYSGRGREHHTGTVVPYAGAGGGLSPGEQRGGWKVLAMWLRSLSYGCPGHRGLCQACLSATVGGKGMNGGPRQRSREPGQLHTQVASDKGAREPPQAMGEGEQSNPSWERGEVSGEMKQGRGNERLSV